MKIRIIVLCVMAVLIHSGIVLVAEAGDHPGHKGSMAEHNKVEEKSKAVNVGNIICPVSGENVEDMGDGIEREYKGKVYTLCCPACAKVFEKDPEKYSKIAEESAESEHKGSQHAH